MKGFKQNGFAILNDFYSPQEVHEMAYAIGNAMDQRPTFRRSNDLFAIRQVLKEIPQLMPIEFSNQELPEGLQWSERSNFQ